MDASIALTAASTFLGFVMGGLYLRERQRATALAAALDLASRGQMEPATLNESATGLLSRTRFDAILTRGGDKVDRRGGSFCVLYLALDNFGMLNDAFGHAVGDELLQSVSQRLGEKVGAKAAICHISAGEFAMIVNGSVSTGLSAAKRVIEVLGKPFQVDCTKTQLSVSIGIACYPEHGALGKLLGHSALAMRSIKSNGGGGFCLYDVKMGVEVREQTMLVNELRQALELNQFELYFQPKMDALSLQVTAAEALLRWHHPERGIVGPDIFIPLAERYGLISAIGNWVLEEACRTAARWRERGLRMRVAVNFSGYQVREDDLVDRIEAALRRHHIQPGRFTCEITESVAMEDTKVTQRTFDKMRQAGFHVSIDDFGTGYSSLGTLRKLPAAELKIDRTFVSDLEESEDARSIVKSIVDMARALGLRVVAEGVETVGQRELLVAMGCDELQGFLFSLPIPAQELERLALDEDGLDEVEFRPSLYAPSLYAAPWSAEPVSGYQELPDPDGTVH
jgi:diguanylate cyclase (GGDEF)-like protein